VDTALLVLSLAVFLALCLYQIDLPGLYADEALDLVPTMQLLAAGQAGPPGQPVELLRGVGVHLGGLVLPVMIMDYLGALNTYLALPFFAVLGPGVLAVRLVPITFSALTIALTYLLGRALFGGGTGRAVGLLAAALLAINPSFVFWSRHGITVTSVLTVLSVGSLLAFLKYSTFQVPSSKLNVDRGTWSWAQWSWLVLGCFVLGLGLWTKFLFLWWIIALGITGFTFQVSRSKFHVSRFTLHVSRFTLGAAAFLLGAAPLLWYNLQTRGATLAELSASLQQPTSYGVNNLDLARNLRLALDALRVFLDGSYFWYLGETLRNPLAVPAFAITVLGSIALVAWQAREHRRPLALVLLLIALIVVQNSFTVSGIWATHLFILFPLPQVVLALCVVLGWQATARRSIVGLKEQRAINRPAIARFSGLGSISPAIYRRAIAWTIRLALVLGLLAVMAGDVRVDWQYHQQLAATGGQSRWSDGVYKLAAYLERRGDPVVAVDWGIKSSVQILTGGRVNPLDITGFPEEAPGLFEGRATQMLGDPRVVYVFHSREDTVYERFPAFQQVAERLGRRLRIIEAFYDRAGRPVYVLWVAE
jgi:4-amino-4-deoxy-L-arabinose transferase-like glycosyltransferase